MNELEAWCILLLLVIFVCFLIYALSKPTGLPAEHMTRVAKQLPKRDIKYPFLPVIVEPRNHPLLRDVIIMMLKKYGKVMYFHGKSFGEKEMGEYKEYIESGALILQKLDVTNLKASTYSSLLLSKEFWFSIPATKILIFQTDSCICSNSPHELDTTFAEYDYIGGATKWSTKFGGGNGGISLRTRNVMIDAIDYCTNTNLVDLPEDMFFSVCMHNNPWLGKIAQNDDTSCSQFGTDGTYHSNEQPFSAHKPSQLSLSNRQHLANYCPETKLWLDYTKKSY